MMQEYDVNMTSNKLFANVNFLPSIT